MTSTPRPSPSPAMAPPDGVTPNFDNPGSLYEENVIAQVVCMTFAGVTFFLRCYARLFLTKGHRQWILEDCESQIFNK